MGGSSDKTRGVLRQSPYNAHNQIFLGELWEASWLAQAICDLPSDEVAVKWRDLEETDQNVESVKVLRKQSKEWSLPTVVTDSYATARLYGGALIIPIIGNVDMTKPKDLRIIRPGDLKRLAVVDRFNVSYTSLNSDITSRNHGYPDHYTIYEHGSSYKVHHTWVCKVDGLPVRSSHATRTSLAGSVWMPSILGKMLNEIDSDTIISNAVAHLVQEASITVVKTPHFSKALQGKTEGDVSVSLKQLAESANSQKSVYRTMYLDKSAEITRLAVTFSGIEKIMQEYAIRLSGAGGIPATILWGRSPAGQNATGEADLRNWDRTISKIQKRIIDPILVELDAILLANAGIWSSSLEMPGWSWPSTIPKDEKMQAEASSIIAKAVIALIDQGIITQAEGRKILDGNYSFGKLPGDPPELESTDLYQAVLKQVQASKNGSTATV